MSSKYLCGDVNFVFSIVEIVVMGFEGAVNIVYCCEIEVVEDKVVTCACFVDEYCRKFVSLFKVVEHGYVDEVIHSREMCLCVICAFAMLCDKRDTNSLRKHGNLLF